jgi:hypothetical protein
MRPNTGHNPDSFGSDDSLFNNFLKAGTNPQNFRALQYYDLKD